MRISERALLAALAITFASRSALAQTAPAPPPSSEQARAFRFMSGVALSGFGLFGWVIGGVLGVRAIDDKAAIGAHCDAAARCDRTGYTLGNEARGSAVISTIGFAMGIGGTAAGVALLVSSAPEKPRVSAWIAPAPGGLSAGVRW